MKKSSCINASNNSKTLNCLTGTAGLLRGGNRSRLSLASAPSSASPFQAERCYISKQDWGGNDVQTRSLCRGCARGAGVRAELSRGGAAGRDTRFFLERNLVDRRHRR